MTVPSKQVFPARLESLEAINAFVTAAAETAGLDDRAIYAVQMAVEEACSNIIEHAYGDVQEGDIECACVADAVGLTITLCDYGQEFDPSQVPEPDLQCRLEDRPVGGLGLYLIYQMMDEVRFECRPDCNLLTMVKRREL